MSRGSREDQIDIHTVLRFAHTDSLAIAYEQSGPDDGVPVVLLHGFPYDVRQYDEVCRLLASRERRVIVPYLRGFGPTRYQSTQVFRSGQQAALGKDLVDLLDVLGIKSAVVAGYDWGGRAACIAAALWPERIDGLLSASAYAVQDIAKAATSPTPPAAGYAHWYQWYLNTRQGEIGLEADREAFGRFLWHLWSPNWHFTDEQYAKTAESFANPDFVATVIHSYRHRYQNAPGDPKLEHLEARLATSPPIGVPTIALHGVDDQVEPPKTLDGQERHFNGFLRKKVVAGVGHCVSAEASQAFSDAVESLIERSRRH